MLLTCILLAITFAAIVSLITRAVIYTKLAYGEIFIHRGSVYKAMIVHKNSRVGQVEEGIW